MKNLFFFLLPLAVVLGFTTSCESQDSNIVAPFTPQQVAMSQEWIDYSFHVDELMTFFTTPESVDMEQVGKILRTVGTAEGSELAFKQQVSELKGGSRYLELSNNIKKAQENLYRKFERSVLDRQMIRRINEAYREIRTTQSID